MRRAAWILLVSTLAASAFAFAILGTAPTEPGARHWATAPLLAFSILFLMGGLVACASARRGTLK